MRGRSMVDAFKGLSVALVCMLCAALVAGTSAFAGTPGSAPAPAHAAKKKCKKGYRLRTVRRHGKRVKVCKKKPRHTAPTTTTTPTTDPTTTTPDQPSGPQGPTVQEVESIIVAGQKAQAPAYLGPDAVEVIFDQPTQVLPVTQWDANGNPLDGAEVQAWPVRAWYRSITHRDSTPDDDTRYYGCEGHLDHAWPHDQILYFFQSAAGGWDFRAGSASSAIGC